MPERHPAHMPKIIAHRGASGSAPENTLAAIHRAAELGAKALEFDVTITADGVAIVLHDSDLDRCSNATGPVALKTMDEIKRLDAGSWFAPRFATERIPTLKQALDAVLSTGMMLNLEIKPTPGWEEPTARAVAHTLKEVWPAHQPILVSSMSTLALDTFHDLMADLALGLIVEAVPENWRQRLTQHHCQSLHCHHAFVTAELAKDIHDADARLHVYTVNDIAKAKALFDQGVDAIFTDFPERLMAGVGT